MVLDCTALTPMLIAAARTVLRECSRALSAPAVWSHRRSRFQLEAELQAPCWFAADGHRHLQLIDLTDPKGKEAQQRERCAPAHEQQGFSHRDGSEGKFKHAQASPLKTLGLRMYSVRCLRLATRSTARLALKHCSRGTAAATARSHTELPPSAHDLRSSARGTSLFLCPCAKFAFARMLLKAVWRFLVARLLASISQPCHVFRAPTSRRWHLINMSRTQ